MYPFFYYILTLVALSSSFWFCYLFYRFRSHIIIPKRDDISLHYSPILANAIDGSVWSKRVGYVDIDGFIATIFDLDGRGFLKIHHNENRVSDEKWALEIIKGKSHLEPYESDVINFLKRFSKHNIVKIQDLKKDLKKEVNFRKSQKMFSHWRTHFFNVYYTKNNKKLFVNKSCRMNVLFGFISLFYALIIFSVTIIDYSPLAMYPLVSSLFLVFVTVIFLILSPNMGIKWAPEGENYYCELQRFKEYIKNPKSVKANPPTSSEMISQYLAFSIALGVSDKAFQSLKSLATSDLKNNNTYILYQLGGYHLLKSIFLDSSYEPLKDDPIKYLRRVWLDAGIRT
jgi:uncharacterized membrane protein